MVLFSDGTILFRCSTSGNISGVSCLIENDSKLHPGYSHRTTRRRLSMFSGVTIGMLLTKEVLRREQLLISCLVCNVTITLNNQENNAITQCLIAMFKYLNNIFCIQSDGIFFCWLVGSGYQFLLIMQDSFILLLKY